MNKVRFILIWLGLAVIIAVPLTAALLSPLLAWREPVYILAGFAGVVGLALLLFQPLLIGGHLPGLPARRGRPVHRWVGIALLASVLIHVGGLWITSPPDVVDALLFVSPTPFSVWGVLAMWAVFMTAMLAGLRRHLRPRNWRLAHSALAVVIVAGTIVHAMQIEGTMELASKACLSLLVFIATLKVLVDLRVWLLLKRRKT